MPFLENGDERYILVIERGVVGGKRQWRQNERMSAIDDYSEDYESIYD